MHQLDVIFYLKKHRKLMIRALFLVQNLFTNRKNKNTDIIVKLIYYYSSYSLESIINTLNITYNKNNRIIIQYITFRNKKGENKTYVIIIIYDVSEKYYE